MVTASKGPLVDPVTGTTICFASEVGHVIVSPSLIQFVGSFEVVGRDALIAVSVAVTSILIGADVLH